ncbi:MAG: DUF502 domain-containing protein [Chitinophagales bacterium]|nr:DUF502 domain-containing protein [Chitinophagales bacterium]MCO5280806.1 DUF502 domain-containing protein [Chitinophagales bacterium]OJV25121.1 MAG: hypothetical protein BGO32_08370 [Bacteroidetes bacterium 37-13]HRN93217.1 DUF502 domain-containing protein [Chitinophagales bacterium]HRP39542.1 DUF502 domain-containing protein [Chitinophagales bacterium]
MNFLKKILTYFIRGAVLITPVFVTFYAIWITFNWLDNNVTDVTELIAGKRIRGIGLLALFMLITFIGMLGSTVLLRPILILFEDILERTPLVKDIYSSLRDFLDAFIGNKAKFKSPVTVEIGKGSGIYRVGFITQKDLSKIKIADKVAVYLPFSYSIAGNVVLVNRDLVQPLEGVTPAEAMKFILSGGVTDFEE